MDRHDPLPVIIDSLMKNRIYPDDIHLPKILQDTQHHVQELRKQFKEIPCDVKYDNEYVRAAYMLAYFPYYIEPIDTVLSRVGMTVLNPIPNRNHIKICFFGGGPTPEALGVMAYLKNHCPSCSHAHFSLLDLYADNWQLCTGLCFDQLQKFYWTGQATHSSHKCNLIEKCNQCEADCTDQLQNADLVILQNCLNDIIVKPTEAVGKAISIFDRMRPDAIFVCIDLNFEKIKRALIAIEQRVTEESKGIVVHQISNEPHKISKSFDNPSELLEHLYIGTDGLIERKYTKFYALALKRTA